MKNYFMSLLVGLMLTLIFQQNTYAQKHKSLEEVLTTYVHALQKKNLQNFISLYAESVTYSDPDWGIKGTFKKAIIEKMFGAYFQPNSKWKVTFTTRAIDKSSNTIMVKGDVVDPKGNENAFAGWFKIKEGQIIEQVDFTTYPFDELMKSPRYNAYKKKENLKKN